MLPDADRAPVAALVRLPSAATERPVAELAGPERPVRDGNFSGGGSGRGDPAVAAPALALVASTPRTPLPAAVTPSAPAAAASDAAEPSAAPDACRPAATAPVVPPEAAVIATLAAWPGLRLAQRIARYAAMPGNAVAAVTVVDLAAAAARDRSLSARSCEPIMPYPTAENRCWNGLR